MLQVVWLFLRTKVVSLLKQFLETKVEFRRCNSQLRLVELRPVLRFDPRHCREAKFALRFSSSQAVLRRPLGSRPSSGNTGLTSIESAMAIVISRR